MKKTVVITILLLSNLAIGQVFNGNLMSNSLKRTMEQKDFTSPTRINVSPMSIKLWDNYAGKGAPSQYGSLLEIYGREIHLVSQLYFNNTWENGGRIQYRSAFYDQNTWEEWRSLLDSRNDIETIGNLKITGNGNGSHYIQNGNLGIGTTAPDEKLTVKGKIHAQEIRADMAGPLVPDYVFANDYKLKSLQEVEEFIKENSHLPEIPSAKEIEKNGLLLAQMNMSLLKKIEEMTLYIIEVNKKLELQGQEIQFLKKNK